jgi:hypothetical protein
MYSFVVDLIAVFLAGCVIKMMDDYLDQEFDIVGGKHSLAQRLGVGAIAYMLVLFALAAACNWRLSVSLFFASYMTGMFYSLKHSYISGLSGLQEVLIVFVVSLLSVGIKLTFAAIFVLIFIQIADDWFDMRKDGITGQRNIFDVIGLAEGLIGGVIFLLGAIYLDSYLTVLVIIGAPLVTWLASLTDTKGRLP